MTLSNKERIENLEGAVISLSHTVLTLQKQFSEYLDMEKESAEQSAKNTEAHTEKLSDLLEYGRTAFEIFKGIDNIKRRG